MALTDIVFYDGNLDVELARGNGGTVTDITVLRPNILYDKIVEYAHVSTGTIRDINVAYPKDWELIPGNTYARSRVVNT